MRKIYLSAGHTNVPGKDRGASGQGYIEGELTIEFRDLVAKYLDKYGNTPVIDSNKNGLRKTLNFFKTLTEKNSIVVDIHWNGFSSAKAHGTEILIPFTPSNFEIKLAKKLAESISSVIGTSLRGKYKGNAGVKTEGSSHHGRLGWMKLTGENVLLEVCFITNKSNMEAYQSEKEALAKRVAEILFKASTAKTTKISKPSVKSVTYTVKKGDSLWRIANNHGLPVSELKKLNNLEGSLIKPGQKLKVKE